MKLARIKKTKEVIEAEDLRFIEKDKMPEFICPDNNCETPLIPAAFTEDSKQRPHFRTLKNHTHSQKCQFSDYAKILEIGGKRKLTLAEFEHLPIPTKLVLPKNIEESDKIKPSKNTDIEEDNPASKKGFLNTFDEGGNNFRNVTTISRIVDFYVACPFNRDIKLNLFGTEKEYMFWFKRIQNMRGEIIQDKSIFFGQLHQDKHAIEKSDSKIRIRLFDCRDWTDGRQVDPYYVNISISDLSKNKIARITNEINYALQAQKEYYQKIQSEENNLETTEIEKAKLKPYIFFFGNQIKGYPYELEVQDGYLVSRYVRIRKTVTE